MTLLGLGVVAVVAAAVWFFLRGPFSAVPDDELAPAARPQINAMSVSAWRAQREDVLRAFSFEVYGPPPPPIEAVVTKRETILAAQAGGVSGVEQWEVTLEAAGRFHLALVMPPGVERAPVILVQNFA